MESIVESKLSDETIIYIVRHGQTNANVNLTIQGQLVNESLNEQGRRQSLAMAERLSDLKLDTIYCSPLKRTRETAAALRKHHTAVPYVELPDLMEMCWGVLEGQSFRGANEVFFNRMRSDWANGDYEESVEGGESIADVHRRAKRSFERIRQESNGRTVAIVTHGRFIRVLLSTILDNYSLLDMDSFLHKNTAISKLKIDPDGIHPEFLCCASHIN